MGTGTGIDAQLMLGEETTWGTPVTPSRGYEFVTESLKQDIERLESKGIRAGTRVMRSEQWAPGGKKVGGSIELELADRGFGVLLKHAFGSVATSTPSGGTLTRDHTFTPGDLPPGLTIQVGRPDLGQVVNPFTYSGCKLASWSLGADVGAIGSFKVDVAAEDETTVTALAVASYSPFKLMTFVEASLTIAGSPQDVRKFELSGDNGLNVDRNRLGSQSIKEPVEESMRTYQGSIDAYFDSLVAYNRYVTGTEAALVLLFAGDTIEGALQYQLEITANVRFDGETPNVGGPGEISQALPYKCVDAGSGAITAVYRTTDTTP